MELRHLEYFVAVAEELHFGRAAERVGIAQPPFSQSIRRLERELGTQLLTRTKRHVELTPAGAAMLPEARAAIAQARRAFDVARRVGSGELGVLSIGFVSSAAYGVLPGVVKNFRARHPGLELDLKELTSDEQIQLMLAGKLDVGFIRQAEKMEGLKHLTIAHEALVAVLPARHPHASDKKISLRDLREDGFVVITPELAPSFHRTVTEACRRAGFTLKIVQETRTAETVVHLVAGGIGVALVPASLTNLRRPGVIYRELTDTTPLIPMSVIWRADRNDAGINKFLEIVRADQGQRDEGRGQKK